MARLTLPTALFLLLSPLCLPAQPVCPPRISERGHWEYNASAAPALALSAFRQPFPCRLYEWRGDGLANRSLAFIGDSVSRYVFFQLAWHLRGCPSIERFDPVMWYGPPRKGHNSVDSRPPGVEADATCDALFHFMYALSHGDHFVPVPALNLTLHFLWMARAFEIVTAPWLEALLARGEVAGVAAGGGPTPPRPDAIFMSVGYWDVSGEGERARGARRLRAPPRAAWAWDGEEANWYVAGPARHCQALSNLEPTFREAYLPSGLREKLVLWGTPYSEPYVNPYWQHSAYLKFPHDKLGVANRCTQEFASAGAGAALPKHHRAAARHGRRAAAPGARRGRGPPAPRRWPPVHH